MPFCGLFFTGTILKELSLLSAVPGPGEKRIAISVTGPALRGIRSGHPWLFENSIAKQSHDGQPGDLAVVFDNKRKFLAVGIYDPFSPIRVRILQRGKGAEIDKEWFVKRLTNAAEIRKPLADTDTDGYRLVHGENDKLPGLVIDRYAETLVVKIYSASWIPHLNNVVSALLEVQPAERVVLRMNRLSQERPEFLHGLHNAQVLYGPELDGVVLFQESGLTFEADPIRGQKTGFFLDQRENRARVEKISKDKNVLNVFSYTGGFSLYAARGGAKSVTSLDISKPAIAGSVRNFELNFSDPDIKYCPHEYIAADAFRVMEDLSQQGKEFDVVIIDPPSFAKKQEEVKAAIKAYAKLVKLGLGLLSRGGTLVMASCSSRVQPEEFFDMIFSTAKSVKRPLTEIERTLHAVDHPIGFREGTYLKCLFARG